MTKYLLLLHEDEAPYDDPVYDLDDVLGQHRDFTAAVKAAGVPVLGGEALQPVATASFLRGTRTRAVHVVDNPTPDVKEVLGGYYLIDVADDDQAIELAKQCPAPYGYVEVRKIWEL